MTTRNPLVRINGKIVDLPASDSIGGAAQGPVGMTWQGAWNSGTSYLVDDVVSSGGSAYIAIAANTNQTPPNATYWNLVAQKGDTGATGATGPTGATGATGASGSGYALISEVITAASATTITFSSIPGTYRNLRLFIYGRLATTSADASNISIQLNSDGTSGNYSATQNAGAVNGAALVTSVAATSSGGIGPVLSGTLTSGTATVDAWETVFPSYANTTFPKVITTVGGGRDGGIVRTGTRSFSWNSTAAITTIVLTAPSAYATGTVAQLYGIS